MKKIIIFLICILVIITSCPVRAEDGFYARDRERMVREQIIARGIKDKELLEAMSEVPRHEFVPLRYRSLAYADTPLPIDENQTISQPYIVALMTELLDLQKDDKALEIGTGSGYQAAILAEMCNEVYTIEIIKKLAKTSETLLKKLGYKNIKVRCGDGYQGWKEYAPFDAIIVTCAPPYIPQPLIEQLEVGGRMVIPVGEFYQELIIVVKTEEGVVKKNVIPVRFVPMTGEAQNKQ